MSDAGLTYDTGALIAAERDNRAMWSIHRAALRKGHVPTVPVGVLAEAWRGGTQDRLSRLLRGCRMEPMDQAQARKVGVLIGRCGLSDTVDVAVAEGAMRRRDVVMTTNRTHIAQVADAANRVIVMHDV